MSKENDQTIPADRIAALNDELRTTGKGGRMVMTCGVAALGEWFIARICVAVREFSDFNSDNDPNGEHDFGKVTVDTQTVFWKVDYYDLTLTFGSDDPSDPRITSRVLTIMLQEEY